MISKNKNFYFASLLFICLIFAFSVNIALAGVAKLTWSPNSSSEGVTEYWVHYGQTSGSYDHEVRYIEASDNPTCRVEDMSDTGVTYFAVTALNSSEERSDFSQEVYKIPGDINKNNVVNMEDIGLLVDNYLNNTCGNPADINVDCNVNMLDIDKLLTNYLFQL